MKHSKTHDTCKTFLGKTCISQ